MKTKAKAMVIGLVVLVALVSAALASADGPWLWQEKCPTLHYEVRVDRYERGVVIVSCVRMAEEEVTPDNID